MTDAAILQQYEDFMDGQSTLSQALEIQLANNAKNKLETELRLEITKKLDTSQTTNVNGTYTTPYTLVADYFLPNDTIFVGDTPYKQIRMERRELLKDVSGFWYVDFRAKQFFLTGIQSLAQVITMPYFFATTDITAASVTAGTTTVTWPDRFHSLISMEMAMLYYAIDAGDKARTWDDRWMAMYKDLKSALVSWDQQMKLAALSHQTPYGSEFPDHSENKLNIM